jgi:hypothetical protein
MSRHRLPVDYVPASRGNSYVVRFSCDCRLEGEGPAPMTCPTHTDAYREIVTRRHTLEDNVYERE